MERKVTMALAFDAAHARAKEEVAGSFELTKRTVAAYVVACIEARFWGKLPLKAARLTAIKTSMMRAGMSNGKAAAYSKVADHVAVNLVRQYGQPDGAEVTQFWADWRDAEDVVVLAGKVRTFLDDIDASSMASLADACGVAYGQNKTAQKIAAELANAKAKARQPGAAGVARKPAPAPEADASEAEAEAEDEVTEDAPVLTREYVFAALCALDAEDAAWVVARYEAARAAMAQDVTPEAMQIAA